MFCVGKEYNIHLFPVHYNGKKFTYGQFTYGQAGELVLPLIAEIGSLSLIITAEIYELFSRFLHSFTMMVQYF